MAIGSHGRGRGGTVGDGRPGRRPTVEKLFSFLRVFVRAAVKTDQQVAYLYYRGFGLPTQ